MTTLDSLLAVALTLRGARVDVLLCDEVLPACQNCLLGKLQDEWVTNEFLRHGPKREICRTCYSPAQAMFESLGVRVLRYSDFLEPDEIETAWRLARTLTPDEICRLHHRRPADRRARARRRDPLLRAHEPRQGAARRRCAAPVFRGGAHHAVRRRAPAHARNAT